MILKYKSSLVFLFETVNVIQPETEIKSTAIFIQTLKLKPEKEVMEDKK